MCFCARLTGDFCVRVCVCAHGKHVRQEAKLVLCVLFMGAQSRGFAPEVWCTAASTGFLTQSWMEMLSVGAGQLWTIICHPIPQTLPLGRGNFGRICFCFENLADEVNFGFCWVCQLRFLSTFVFVCSGMREMSLDFQILTAVKWIMRSICKRGFMDGFYTIKC